MHRSRRTCSAFPTAEKPVPSAFPQLSASPPQQAQDLKRPNEVDVTEERQVKRTLCEASGHTELELSAPQGVASTEQPTGDEAQGTSSSLAPPCSPSTNQSAIAEDIVVSESSGIAITPPLTPATKPLIFCDLDGVLTDFECSVRELCGRPPEQCQKDEMWSKLMAVKDGGPDGFYSQLPWTDDGPALWEAIAPLDPIILSGCPKGTWAAQQKRRWCARELGPHVEVRTCLAQQKCHHSCKGAVLIDDRLSLRSAWQARGGRFIQHTSTANTIVMLHQLGVLPLQHAPDRTRDTPPSSGE
eukprot:GGOE01040949.1.p1 GENE.GGOE01040949.1~~GGOE01040949.1.p1  ORF type:complete len:300 (-),score=58.71 GGOE01040949.1:116-1015(-)